jgi:hypothetical protein
MPWRKDRPLSPGDLEFHLPADPEARRHDDAWLRERAEKLNARHRRT